MDGSSRPSRREGVLSSTSGESIVLLVPETGEYFTVEEVGARIWALADGSRSVRDIAGALAAEYDAPAATIEQEALDFLQELENARLIVPADSGE
jgi:hypothetical protein